MFMGIQINIGGELQEIRNAIQVVWTDERLHIHGNDGQEARFDSANVISIHRIETNYEDSFVSG